MNILIELNGNQIEKEVAPGKRLIDWLRDDMGLTGTKEGCGEGECGACTVLLDDKPVNSCLVLMGQINGKKVTTIEGLQEDAQGEKLIESFVEHGAVQCGFCTPGMVAATVPLINKKQPLSEDEIKHAISGNLCRCTGYAKIIEAVQQGIKVNK